jgi:hypothetical protein
MRVKGKSISIVALAVLGWISHQPAGAFDWPVWRKSPQCQGCGQKVASSFFPRNVIYRSGVIYHDSCVPPPPGTAAPYQAAPYPSAPGYETPAPSVPATPGEPSPESPSTIPGSTPPGMLSETSPPTPATSPGGTEAEAAANAVAAADNAATAASSGLGGALGGAQGALNMFGDLAPFSREAVSASQTTGFRPPSPPEPPGTRPTGLGRSTIFNPVVRTFKVSDNQTPMPVDRLTFSYNYFDYVNQSVNQRLNVPIDRIQAMRYVFGFEKMFWDGRASVGLRLPLNNVVGNSNVAGLGKDSTAVGDLSAYFKYALLIDREKGRVLSGGLAVTMPTGPTNFAGADWLRGLHYTNLQPFVAFQYTWDRAYAIGFTSVDIPTSSRDALLIYNDLGLGYYIYRNPDPNSRGWIKAVAPTVEVHVNSPTNHRDVFNARDLAGTAEVVDMTSGLNIFLPGRTVFSLGIVDPVTGPRPFSLEALALLNVFF